MSQNTPVISATGQAIPPGSGTVQRVIVCSNSSGTLKLNDSPNSAAGRVMLDTFTFAAGSQVVTLGMNYSEGVFATVGGSANLIFVYDSSIN